jgi:hypothetical protein
MGHEERTSAPCPDTCQTNLRGVVNSCREPPLYSTLSSLQSGASCMVPFFLWYQCVCTGPPGPLHGATDDNAERASSLREARHGPEHDARREETPLDRSPNPGRVRLARVASGSGSSGKEGGKSQLRALGWFLRRGDLGPSSGKDGGGTAAACNGLRIAA